MNTKEKTTLPEIRKKLSRQGGMTQFSARIGLHYMTVYRTLLGTSRNLATIRKVCAGLGIEVSDVKEWSAFPERN